MNQPELRGALVMIFTWGARMKPVMDDRLGVGTGVMFEVSIYHVSCDGIIFCHLRNATVQFLKTLYF